MAEAKATKTQVNTKKEREDFYNEKVAVTVRRPEGTKENFCTVTVNGVNYQIAYGKEVFVPRFVKLILDESDRNRETAEEASEELAQQFINGKAALGEV